MDMGLKQRVVLVTGGSSGIGRATAIAFAAEGARVALTYASNPRGAEETAAAVQRAGGEALVVPYDIEDDRSIFTAVKGILERWRRIDILVNNAVRWPSWGRTSFEDVPVASFRAAFKNLEGAFCCVQAVLPSMREQRWGRIVNVSSSLAEDSMANAAPYAAVKAGLHGLTATLAVELGPAGILTNVVMPGLTVTEKGDKPQSLLDQVARATPSRRLSTAEDLARTIVFLGSEANGNVNGEIVRVTGGARGEPLLQRVEMDPGKLGDTSPALARAASTDGAGR